MPHVFVAGDCEETLIRDFTPENQDIKVRLVAVKTGDMILLDIDNHTVERVMIKNI